MANAKFISHNINKQSKIVYLHEHVPAQSGSATNCLCILCGQGIMTKKIKQISWSMLSKAVRKVAAGFAVKF
jgi:hypothetical protein